MLPRLFYAFGVYGTLDTRELVKLCVIDAGHNLVPPRQDS